MVCYLTSSGCHVVSLWSAFLNICVSVCVFSCVCIFFAYIVYHMYVFSVRLCVCVCALDILCNSTCMCVCSACHVHSLVTLILASPNLLCWTVRIGSCWVWLQTACRAVPIQHCSITYAWEKTRLFTCTPLICYTGRFYNNWGFGLTQRWITGWAWDIIVTTFEQPCFFFCTNFSSVSRLKSE